MSWPSSVRERPEMRVCHDNYYVARHEAGDPPVKGKVYFDYKDAEIDFRRLVGGPYAAILSDGRNVLYYGDGARGNTQDLYDWMLHPVFESEVKPKIVFSVRFDTHAGKRAVDGPGVVKLTREELAKVGWATFIYERMQGVSRAADITRHPFPPTFSSDFHLFFPNNVEKDMCNNDLCSQGFPCDISRRTVYCRKANTAKDERGWERPTDKSCWRYSYQFHLIEAVETGGFMLQIVEPSGLGPGQQVETTMAEMAGIHVIELVTPNYPLNRRSDEAYIDMFYLLSAEARREWRCRKCGQYMDEFVPCQPCQGAERRG